MIFEFLPRQLQIARACLERKAKGAGCVKKPAIVDRDRNALALLSEKFHRCQMEGIQGTDRFWERLQGSREHRRGKLNKCDAAQQGTHLIRMRPGEFARMNPSPDFIFKQAAGNQILVPKPFGWRPVFRHEVSRGQPKYRDRSTLAPVALEFPL